MPTPMWLARNLTMSVQIMRRVRSGSDEYGNDVYTDQVVPTKGYLRPVAGTDIQSGRANTGSYLLILPAEAARVIDGFVSFVVDGVSYEADGPGLDYAPLHSAACHHVEIAVVRGSA